MLLESAGMGTTSDPSDPSLGHGVDDTPVEQNDKYLVLSDAERSKGFVRPYREVYIHVDCTVKPGCHTIMSRGIAETYARNPKFYGSTYCTSCKMHRPLSEFRWADAGGFVTEEVVGS